MWRISVEFEKENEETLREQLTQKEGRQMQVGTALGPGV